MNEARQYFVDIDCPELSHILTRRISDDSEKSPRTSSFIFRLVYGFSNQIKIDQYRSCSKLWTEIGTIDLQIQFFGMIHRDGKLIIIGGTNAQNQPINAVISNISTHLNSSVLNMKKVKMYRNFISGEEHRLGYERNRGFALHDIGQAGSICRNHRRFDVYF